MRRDDGGLSTLWYSWPTNYQRHVGILFEGKLLARTKAMIAKVKAVITAIDDVCVIELVVLLEDVDNLLDNVVYRQ